MKRFLWFYLKALLIVTAVLFGGIGTIRGLMWLFATYPVAVEAVPFVAFILLVSFFVAGVLDVRDADRRAGR